MNELFRTLPKVLKELKDNDDVREAIVFAAWKKIAGDSLNEQTVAKKLVEKRLTIAVTGEMWKKHLESLSGQMIFKLNSMLGQALVTFIEFQVDESLVVERRKRKAISAEENQIADESALKKISPKLQKAANAIEDETLRNQFLLAAGNCLVRQEHLKAKK